MSESSRRAQRFSQVAIKRAENDFDRQRREQGGNPKDREGFEFPVALGKVSIGRVNEKAILRVRSSEECLHATHCVATEVSIHVLPGLRPTPWRSDR